MRAASRTIKPKTYSPANADSDSDSADDSEVVGIGQAREAHVASTDVHLLLATTLSGVALVLLLEVLQTT